jgi:hypothetical protein
MSKRFKLCSKALCPKWEIKPMATWSSVTATCPAGLARVFFTDGCKKDQLDPLEKTSIRTLVERPYALASG